MKKIILFALSFAVCGCNYAKNDMSVSYEEVLRKSAVAEIILDGNGANPDFIDNRNNRDREEILRRNTHAANHSNFSFARCIAALYFVSVALPAVLLYSEGDTEDCFAWAALGFTGISIFSALNFFGYIDTDIDMDEFIDELH